MFAKIKFQNLFLIVLSLVFFSGCGTVAIYNSQNNLIPTEKNLDNEHIYQAIKIGALSKGWMPKKIADGLVEAKINVRNKHFAVVHISYNSNSYSINYISSENLKSDGESIHSKYNSWIVNLKNAIDYQLSNIDDVIALESSTSKPEKEVSKENKIEEKETNSTDNSWR